MYKESSDLWNGLSESEKTSIEKGIEDAEAGRQHSNSEARNIYANGFKPVFACLLE